MIREELLQFSGVSRTVLEARIVMLVKLLDEIDADCSQTQDLINRVIQAQLERENGG